MIYFDQQNLETPAFMIHITETKSPDYSRNIAKKTIESYCQRESAREFPDANPMVTTNTTNQSAGQEFFWSGSSIELDHNGIEHNEFQHIF